MSAIAGIYHINNEPVPIEHTLGMMGNLQKYPANDVGTFLKENLFLGCHAQWITPESIGEKLPYYDHQRKLAITADAIIDNRDELFEMLQVEKHKRKEMPDSELILNAYYKWGEDSPKFLIGDFAFVIWDEGKKKLFGARDFSGSRTLYYCYQKSTFAFCTTVEPILTLPLIKKELNEEWLAEYLAISGVIDTGDTSLTPYKDINQVPPSHSISIVGNRIEVKRYCALASEEKLNLKSDQEYVEAFQSIFQRAVNDRLRTHLNIGSQLSGGLDSGAVVSYAVQHLRKSSKKLNTFSYIPPSDFIDYTPKQLLPDERPFISSTINHVGHINGHFLELEGKDSFSEIDDYLDLLEMPYKFFENSFWQKGIYEKSRELGIGILLNGGRGNMSISWGSALDYYAILLKKFKWIKLYHELHHYSINAGGPRLRRVPRIAKIAFPFLDNWFSKNELFHFPQLINDEFARNTGIYNKLNSYGMDQYGWFGSNNIYEQRKRHFEDVFHWNATNIKSTKLSLRYSLWERDPTNDLRVIRFCLSIPEEQYVREGRDRALIRYATKGFLPDKVRLNQRVRGVQGADWVHRMIPHWTEFLVELEKIKSDEMFLKYINEETIDIALSKARSGVQPKKAMDSDYRILMRSLILYRFIKRFN